MRYRITHLTSYTYDRPVMLSSHMLRLRPRCDVTQTLHQFSLEINPEPSQISESIDLDGNSLLKLWFPETEVTTFSVQATSEVETCRSNPFNYLLDPWATHLPIDYPSSLLHQLQPYLGGQFYRVSGAIDLVAMQLAQEIWDETGGSTTAFLNELNQRIYQTCGYMMREQGAAHPPGITWTKKAGSCRDYAVLFIEVCRAIGLAARFVSGYQEGDLNSDDRQLHAWAEVYLPGAGWRGYDPTNGLAVADKHIAIFASPLSKPSAPVTGSLKQAAGAQSKMQFHLSIKAL
jgi:transglutaminase-like putative cysteine protease